MSVFILCFILHIYNLYRTYL